MIFVESCSNKTKPLNLAVLILLLQSTKFDTEVIESYTLILIGIN